MPAHITREEARAQRLQLFFDGAPCSRGHLAPRRVATGSCTACLRRRRQRSRQLEIARAEREHDRYLRRLYLESRFSNPKQQQAAYKRNYRARLALRRQEQQRLTLERTQRSTARAALRAIAAHLNSTHLLRNSLTYRRVGLTGPALRLWLEAQWLPGMTWQNYGPKQAGCWSVTFRVPPQGLTGLDATPSPMHHLNLLPAWNHLPPPEPPPDAAVIEPRPEDIEDALLQHQQIARQQKRRAGRRLRRSPSLHTPA